MAHSEIEYRQAVVKATAAQTYLEARHKDFDATLLVGSAAELEQARLSVVAAFEGLLDAKTRIADLTLKEIGMGNRGGA